MTEHLYAVLDELVPRFDNEPGDWSRVIAEARAGEPVRTSARPLDMTPENRPRSRKWLTRRPIAVIAIAVVAIATPLLAAGSQDWWFLRAPLPDPITDVKVVKSGEWDGKPWQLVAYRSTGNEICYGVVPRSTSGTTGDGEGGAVSCIRIAGVPQESDSEEPRLGVLYASGPSPALPAYVAGPIVDSADAVEIHLVGGEIIRTPTFDAPDELGSIRFYGAQLAETDSSGGQVQKLVGIDHDGEVVACLALPMTPPGTPPSTCP